MEGWDANRDGSPTEHTLRRWRNFGRSGAKLIWGGEAAAVQPDGRANPNQTLATADNRAGLAALLDECLAGPPRSLRHDRRSARRPAAHPLRPLLPPERSKPLEPRIAYHHPLLDAKFGIDPHDDSRRLDRRRARAADRRLRRRRRPGRTTSASSSST